MVTHLDTSLLAALESTDTEEGEMETCPECGGTGEYRHYPLDDGYYVEVLNCETCDGTGRVPVEEDEQ
jgi:DnaJ-class molecular chaperone